MASLGPRPRVALPAEATDHVIDHLFDDIPSLKSSALVCRAWLPACRFHLFNETSCYPARPGKTHLDLLLWAIASRDAAAYVEALSVEHPVNVSRPMGPTGPEVAVRDVDLLLTVLPNVNSLLFRGVALTPYIPHEEASVPSFPRRIKKLIQKLCFRGMATTPRPAQEAVYIPSDPRRIEDLSVCMGSMVDSSLFHLLLLFSEIGMLSLVNVRYTWTPSSADTPLIHALYSTPRVNGLYLQSDLEGDLWSGYRGVLHVYRHSQPRWPLRSFWMAVPTMLGEDALDDILRECRETITTLTVSPLVTMLQWLEGPALPAEAVPTDRWRMSSLRECHSLGSLNIVIVTAYPEGLEEDVELRSNFSFTYDATLAATADLVLSAPVELEEVGLVFSHMGKGGTLAVEIDVLAQLTHWSRLDDALVGLPNVKEVACVLPGALAPRTDTAALVASFGMEDFWYPGVPGGDVESNIFVAFLKRQLPRTEAAGHLRIIMSTDDI